MNVVSLESGVTVVIGGQFGSEGKGEVVHWLADRFDIHVRVGGPNAGHCFTHAGKKWAMQQVPCGWTNPKAQLFIGRGALISLEVLHREISAIMEAGFDVRDRLFIDAYAGIITDAQKAAEGGVSGEIHQRIGSTGEGVGAARLARVSRDTGSFVTVAQAAELPGNQWLRGLLVGDVQVMLSDAIDQGTSVMIEGTQGAGLSLVHGQWPYVTSHDTNVCQILADVGLPPVNVNTIMVCRTFPIRVAGNSGPLAGELSWEQMADLTGVEGLIEHTTVTKKPRRIGAWDWPQVMKAVRINRPDAVVLTFLDYAFPSCAGLTSWESLPNEAKEYIERIERTMGTRIIAVGTGPGVLIPCTLGQRRPSAEFITNQITVRP